MLKEFAWKTFENTGNIDSYIFFKEIEGKAKFSGNRKIAEDEAATSNDCLFVDI